MTLAETAQRLVDGFETKQFPEIGASRVIIRRDTPDTETLRAMVNLASSVLNIDDAYEMTRDALQQIADTEPDEISDTSRDSLIDVYTNDLMPWLARNWQLADEMREEFGEWPATMNDIAMQTQDYAYGIVLSTIESNWPEDESSDDE